MLRKWIICRVLWNCDMETLNEDGAKKCRARGSAGYSRVNYNVVKQTPVGYPLYGPDII
jgi:hypothetical protein